MPADEDLEAAPQSNTGSINDHDKPPPATPTHVAQNATAPMHDLPPEPPPETGGQAGPEPTRYGDWEKKGRCTDF